MKQPNGEVPSLFSARSALDLAQPPHSSAQNGVDELTELRALLVGSEITQLASLRDRLENALLGADDVSRVLPAAILSRSKTKDKQLTTALTPTIEAALSASAKRNPQSLVDTMTPVIGPALRQAIGNTFGEYSQRLRQVLERSVSFKGLRWRFEAWRTGRPFADIVLSHTLLYRVEQVFLVHKKTGHLLYHVGIEEEDTHDADMVSSMLSAIQSFVQDASGTTKDELVESFQVGELTVEVEQGPQAFLAAVIRGNPPRRLRRTFLEALESIHLECARELEEFTGDTTPFLVSRPYLEECLQVQTDALPKKGRRAFPWGVRLLLFGLGAALMWWGYHAVQDYRRWSAYIERLNTEPGVVVVTSEKQRGKRFIKGLRDPLAIDPMVLLQEVGISQTDVISQWEPYQALHPQFILTRAKDILAPPEGVSLGFDNGTLTVVGSPPRPWVEDARKLARAIPGVTRFVETTTKEAAVTPTPPSDPTANARQLQRKEMVAAKERLEQQTVQFLADTLDLMSGQEAAVKDIAGTIRVLLSAAQFIGQTVKIEVVGHADSNDAPLEDQVLGLTRAERVIAELVRNGVTQSDLAVLKARIEDAPQGRGTAAQGLQGKVSFRVRL